MVDFKKWEILSIPERDFTKPIPFSAMDREEYALVIKTHKQFVTLDDVEISLKMISSDLKTDLETIKYLFEEEQKVKFTFINELD